MAQAVGRSRLVGEYVVGRQIGAGSFSVVWHGRHKVHGTEVAIKEIATLRLNKKLQESLMSEIFILKRITHPNIICLHDIIQVPGKIHLVLEYCKGGDLSLYIQRHGRVPEATAKHFMQQLAAGLLVLRDNNLIHRDLKPQNLLLSQNDEKAVLKIADFGFARSLQPRGLAETLCGSPLYMAPEIMQLQKYDAKADLWSVGAILFQLVTGRTPFTGNNQIQLLQNILKSTELQFPSDCPSLSFECKDLCQKLLRRNPVERLTFEEFFNHPFLSQKQREQDDEPLRSRSSSRLVGGFFSTVSDPLRRTEENYQEDCLPFILDDDSGGPEGSPSFSRKKSSIKSTYGFDLNSKLDKAESTSPISNNINSNSGFRTMTQRSQNTNRRLDNRNISRNLTDPLESPEQIFANPYPKVTDSLENIDQEYVLVPGPPIDVSSSSVGASRPSHTPYRSGSLPQESSSTITRPSAPMPIVGAHTNSMYRVGSSGSQDSAPGTSLGSMEIGDEQPSAHCMARVKSLQQCASAITELVNEKSSDYRHSTMATGSIISLSGSPNITSEKLNGKNYLSWSAAVEMWFLGHGCYDHLEQDETHVPAEKADKWKQADFQLCALLWQSVEPQIFISLRAFKTCYSFWKKAQSIYANDIQRLYDTANKLASLKMENHDMVSFMAEAQSVTKELRMFLEAGSSEDIKTRLDKYYMVMILRALHPDLAHIRDQLLTSHEVPSMESLTTRLLRVPMPHPQETFGAVEQSAMIITCGRGRGTRGGGRGGRGRGPCTYCKRMGHTQENCYLLHGFPPKTANISQSNPSYSKFTEDEYQEYLRLKSNSMAQTSSSTTCISQSPKDQTSWVIDSGASDHISGAWDRETDWRRI